MEPNVPPVESEYLTTAHRALRDRPRWPARSPPSSLPCSLCFYQVCFLNPKARCIATSGPLQVCFSTS